MTMEPYQLCSKEECIERQQLGQVSEFEATLETCVLPQAKRILDPRLAVCKYRRSAAGSTNQTLRNRDTLFATLDHLSEICATFQATPKHPRVDDVSLVVDFVVDRLRACQSDGTRLMGTDTPMPASWHAMVIRFVLWIQHCCWTTSTETSETDSLLPRTLHTIRSTAYDAYWGTNALLSPEIHLSLDDEMLCYEAISRISTKSRVPTDAGASFDTSWNGMLLEFCKHKSLPSKNPSSLSYPLWELSLQLASNVCREEYSFVWRNERFANQLPILAKCILNAVLFPWKYQTVRQYNVSFAKGECVTDMDRLLGIAPNHWSLEYAEDFGLPSKVTEEGLINITMKQISMPDLSNNILDTRLTRTLHHRNQAWVFGELFNADEPMGVPPSSIQQLLHSGYGSNKESSTVSESIGIKQKSSSLLQALSALASDPVKPAYSGAPITAATPKSTRPSKKERVKCKFFVQGSCRFGDRCRFAHSP